MTWSVIIPGQTPVNTTYFNITSDGRNLTDYITTSVTRFESDRLIKSLLRITVHSGMPTNQILLRCSISDLEYETINGSINTSGEQLMQ